MPQMRPFVETDYPRFVEINNALYPEYPFSLAEFKSEDAAFDTSRYEHVRLAAELDGNVVGWGQIRHMPGQFDPRHYYFEVQVDPAWQQRGIGSAIYDHFVAELRARNAELARTNIRESMTESVAFARQRGFREIERNWESRLDVNAPDAAIFAGVADQIARDGITITTLAAERARDPDVLPAIHEMQTISERDMPSASPRTDIPYDVWLKREIEVSSALPDGFFLAKDGDHFVGLSSLFSSDEEPHVIYQGLTATLPEYRGRGIAKALKHQTVAYARARGKREIRTWNNTLNAPMLRINEAMGFQKQPVWIRFQKDYQFDAGDAASDTKGSVNG